MGVWFYTEGNNKIRNVLRIIGAPFLSFVERIYKYGKRKKIRINSRWKYVCGEGVCTPVHTCICTYTHVFFNFDHSEVLRTVRLQ